MIWGEDVPVVTTKDEEGRGTRVKVIHGAYQDVLMYQSTPDSWAADPENHVRILLIELEPMARFTLNSPSKTATRMLYYYQGEGLQVEEAALPHQDMYAQLAEGEEINIENGPSISKILILESNPIQEPVVQYGPFVMNTQEEIVAAFNDYRASEFGGWKWDEPGTIHPKNKGRFAEYGDGKIDLPNGK